MHMALKSVATEIRGKIAETTIKFKKDVHGRPTVNQKQDEIESYKFFGMIPGKKYYKSSLKLPVFFTLNLEEIAEAMRDTVSTVPKTSIKSLPFRTTG